MTDLRIRALGENDSIPELTRFLHRAYRPLAERGLRYLAGHQDESMTRRRISKGECFLAELGGRLVGTITLREAHHTKGCPWYDRADVASFGQFAVDPDLQRRGIGSELLESVERRAAEKGVRELACDTAEEARHLIEMYRKRGYRFIDYVRWDVVNYRSVVLSKTLTSIVG